MGLTKKHLKCLKKNELIEIILRQQKDIQALQKQMIVLQENIQTQQEIIQQLRDEIARLKGHNSKPKIKPSNMDKGTEQKAKEIHPSVKRAGSEKRSKTKEIVIHHEETISPIDPLPLDAEFKGYKKYVVQGLRFCAHNTLYKLERWKLSDGKYATGQLPDAIKGKHFDPQLEQYVLYQYHHCNVTQPLILEQLHEIGIDISSGQINRILTEGHEVFHQEKDAVYRTGVDVSEYLTVDDTSCRHQGKNGYTTHIGSALFAWFSSTRSKSRINFLELLQQSGNQGYQITEYALAYMKEKKLKNSIMQALKCHALSSFASKELWEAHMISLDIHSERHVQIVTEGALIGQILSDGILNDMTIVSDDAGQFNILVHALCWIHAERTIHKLHPLNDAHQVVIDSIRTEIWDYYADLKLYKQSPNAEIKATLDKRFDEIFTQKTGYKTLNESLKRLDKNKAELLMVLDQPQIPLHTNDSERDIRGVVGKRKVSGGTRSDPGQRARDTFASLKRTCRRNAISFWNYLGDRLLRTNNIPPLPQIIRQNVAA